MNARNTLILLGLLATLAMPAAAGDDDHGAAGGPPAFDRFRALAGEWVAAEDSEMVKKGDLVARYEVTSGGSAVIETVFPGTPHEMVTVYHADGEDVVLTHYCLGNQPRMRARGSSAERVRVRRRRQHRPRDQPAHALGVVPLPRTGPVRERVDRAAGRRAGAGGQVPPRAQDRLTAGAVSHPDRLRSTDLSTTLR
jgi:hypothetical protein